MYNKSPFNRSQFGRQTDSQCNVAVSMGSRLDMVIAPIKIRAKLPETNLKAAYEVQCGNVWIYIPVVPVTVAAEINMSAPIAVWYPLRAAEIGAETSMSIGAVRTAETEELTLEGLHLKPGQILIIDTDTLDIEVDSETRVDCWVEGGTFFQLKNGQNNLTFSDNARSRNLSVTVLWADRYL